MYDDVVSLIERSRIALPTFGSGVSLAAIERTKKALGLSLPESFKWWLRNYGGGQIGGDVVYGIDEFGEGRADVADLADSLRRDGFHTEGTLVFLLGNEERFVFDTSDEAAREWPVLHYDEDQGATSPYTSSFADFLRRRIRELQRLVD